MLQLYTAATAATAADSAAAATTAAAAAAAATAEIYKTCGAELFSWPPSLTQ